VGSRVHAGLGPAGLAVVITVIVVLFLAFASTLPSRAQTKLIGKWGIDVEKLGDMEEIKKMPADQREKAIEMAKSFAGSMSFEFTNEKLIMEAMGQKKEGTYKVTKAEGKKLTIEATLDGKTETFEADVAGEGVILGKGKEKFALKRK
jgi:hypothetical protein